MWNSIYIYIEKKSTSRYSQFFLSIVAFIESIFFPIPPDVILIPLIHFNKKKFFRSVINCTLFSILGGAAGYFLGLFLFDSIKGIVDLSKQELYDSIRVDIKPELVYCQVDKLDPCGQCGKCEEWKQFVKDVDKKVQ